jgi:hypothetical protein
MSLLEVLSVPGIVRECHFNPEGNGPSVAGFESGKHRAGWLSSAE